MEKNSVVTRVLATVGVILAWIPIVAPVVLSLRFSIASGLFRMDYLMPAELFPAALVGGLLLLWAAIRTRSQRALIGWELGIMIGALAGVSIAAAATGLASGATEPTGWPWILVMTLLGLYILAVIAIAVTGILLLKDLFRKAGALRNAGSA